jgi:integrase
MPVEYRRDRKRWGYRVCLAGVSYKKYAWATKAEAKQAEAEFLTDLKKNPPLPENSLEAVCSDYLVEAAEKRSWHHLKSLRSNFANTLLPFFGPNTPITAVTGRDVEQYVAHLKKRGLKNNSVWNYKTYLAALFNWAIKKKLARVNPVKDADLSVIKNRRPVKAPLNMEDIEFAASVLTGYDRAYFDFMRCTGLRKDEANRAMWEDVDFEKGWLKVRGTKTENAADRIPLAPALKAILYEHRQNYPHAEFIFPNRNRGGKAYDRDHMFEKIQKLTARARYAKLHPELTPKEVAKAVKAQNHQGGVKLCPKDMRDIFGTTVMDSVSNPDITRRLMRHTSLATTTKYMREVPDRMQDAVKNLGCNLEATLGGNSGGNLVPKTTQDDIIKKLALERLLELRQQELNRNLPYPKHGEKQLAMNKSHIGRLHAIFA